MRIQFLLVDFYFVVARDESDAKLLSSLEEEEEEEDVSSGGGEHTVRRSSLHLLVGWTLARGGRLGLKQAQVHLILSTVGWII